MRRLLDSNPTESVKGTVAPTPNFNALRSLFGAFDLTGNLGLTPSSVTNRVQSVRSRRKS